MSLYDESIEVVEYQQMLEDIKSDRERLDTSQRWVHPLADRPDIVIDNRGDTWMLAPVSKNSGIMVPIFYRYTKCRSRIVGRETRQMRTGQVKTYRDDTPKTAKPTKR